MSTLQSAPGADLMRKAGLQRIADHFGVIPYAVYKWTRFGTPPERVHALARFLGCRAHDLRPDLFGPRDRGPERNTKRSVARHSDNPVSREAHPD